MKSKKELLKKSRLYIILDKKICGRRPILNLVNKIKKTDTNIIQFRDKISNRDNIIKTIQSLHKLLLASKTAIIINDYLDIAKIVDIDGIHLGQDDVSVGIARKILGKDKIIGVSCHNLKQAIRAQKNGADYLSIGPIFKTPTKPTALAIGLGLIKKVGRKIKIPFFVIGGIDQNNLNQVLSSGAKRVAVCRAVCKAKDIISSIKNLSECIS